METVSAKDWHGVRAIMLVAALRLPGGTAELACRSGKTVSEFRWPSVLHESPCLQTRQFVRTMREWVACISLDARRLRLEVLGTVQAVLRRSVTMHLLCTFDQWYQRCAGAIVVWVWLLRDTLCLDFAEDCVKDIQSRRHVIVAAIQRRFDLYQVAQSKIATFTE